MNNLRESLSKGLHNIISNSPPKTERLLSLFLLAVIALMSLTLFLVMTQGLKKDLTDKYVDTTKQKGLNLIQEIDRYLNTRLLLVTEQANSSIIKQFVMNPGQNYGLIKDFFAKETVLGEQYAQVIYDFRGAKLFSSDQVIENHQKTLKNISIVKSNLNSRTYEHYSQLYKNKMNNLVFIELNPELWEIAIPINYGKSTEGVLVTYLPINDISHKLNLDNLIGVSVRVDSLEGNIIWGNKHSENWSGASSANTQLHFSYSIDTSSVEQSFTEAKFRLLLSLAIIGIIAGILAITFGRWFFVSPLERLRNFSKEISDGADPHLEHTKRITIEIQELSDQITDMAKKIHLREAALMRTNEQLKNNQDTLVLAEKMAGLGQVTAGVAHEINNPIGFIMNNLTMLQEYHVFIKQLVDQLMLLKASLSAEQEKELSGIIQAINQILKQEDLDFVINDLDCITSESITGAERVKEITQALKGYAYSGEKTSLVDLNECIEATLKMVWNELKYHCSVEKHLSTIPQVECMGGQINQVLMNLFINAAHAMKDRKGELFIETGLDEQYVFILIKDNGCGIDSEHLKQIFDPFFTTKPVGEGTGLGMSICYDIIKKHGGTINVSSEINVGTEFKIRLPLEKV